MTETQHSELQRTGANRATRPAALVSRRRNRSLLGVIGACAVVGLGVAGFAQTTTPAPVSAQELPSVTEISQQQAQSFSADLNGAVAEQGRGDEGVNATLEPLPSPSPSPAESPKSSGSGSSSSSGGGSYPAGGSYSAGSLQAYAASLMSSQEFGCFDYIISKESGWNPYIANSSSGAYGLPQALPGSKMASAGADWATNGETQIRWAIGYMNDRYGSICGAYSFWLSNHHY